MCCTFKSNQFIIHREVYIEIQTKMDAIWEQANELLKYFNEDWLKVCGQYPPKHEEWQNFDEMFGKHVFAMYQLALDRSCLPSDDLKLKEESIQSRLLFLPQILLTKKAMHSLYDSRGINMSPKFFESSTIPYYKMASDLETFMKNLLHDE